MRVRINSIEELKSISSENSCDCYIMFNGDIRSSKNIFYDEEAEVFEIHNEIDGSEQVLSEKELAKETRIVDAINNMCFYKY